MIYQAYNERFFRSFQPESYISSGLSDRYSYAIKKRFHHIEIIYEKLIMLMIYPQIKEV